MLWEMAKWIVLVFAGLYAGMGWDAFWKTIDYTFREWVKSHPIPGKFIEMMIDTMHHAKSAVVLLTYAFWMLFPKPEGVFLMCFALGMILVDAPREKDRILEIIKKIMLGKSVEEEVTELVEEITEGVDESDKLLAEQLLSDIENKESGEETNE